MTKKMTEAEKAERLAKRGGLATDADLKMHAGWLTSAKQIAAQPGARIVRNVTLSPDGTRQVSWMVWGALEQKEASA